MLRALALILALIVQQTAAWAADAPPMCGAPVPGSDAACKTELSEDSLLPELNATQENIFNLLQEGKNTEAKKAIQSALSKAQNAQDKNEALEELAYVDLELGNPRVAITELQSLPQPIRSSVLTQKRIGDLYLKLGDKTHAVAAYKAALDAAKGTDSNDRIVQDILEALVGSYMQNEQFEAAQPYGEKLVAMCEERAKSGKLLDVGSLYWADVWLLQIYKQTNGQLHAELVKKAIPNFDRLWQYRAENEGKTPEDEEALFDKVQKAMFHSFIEENKPETLSDYLWLASQFRMRSMPLITWQPQDNSPKAVILCVHGLGLENRAFQPFAQEMTARHFAIYAMDVRGFGAWQSEFGTETVNFTRTLNDVHAVINLIKAKHPGLPVFLLGESMGGGIALRSASEFGGDMTGVIASVPSAERYGEKRMAAQVALHFLHPKKPFDIGTKVSKQATSQEGLREMWKRDPKAKIDYSPVELIKFDQFMRETKQRCSSIQSTPVVIVQGLADKLVKPQGTYEMFDNVNAPDKTMIILGSAEHLIFETPKQDHVLLDGLTAWLNNHITPSAHTTGATQNHVE